MIFAVCNDGKNGPQSFEVWCTHYGLERGYGRTETEALADYLTLVRARVFEMRTILEARDGPDEFIQVDMQGNAL